MNEELERSAFDEEETKEESNLSQRRLSDAA